MVKGRPIIWGCRSAKRKLKKGPKRVSLERSQKSRLRNRRKKEQKLEGEHRLVVELWAVRKEKGAELSLKYRRKSMRLKSLRKYRYRRSRKRL